MKKNIIKIPLFVSIYYLLTSFVAYIYYMVKTRIGFYLPRVGNLYNWWWAKVEQNGKWSYKPYLYNWKPIIISSCITVLILIFIFKNKLKQKSK